MLESDEVADKSLTGEIPGITTREIESTKSVLFVIAALRRDGLEEELLPDAVHPTNRLHQGGCQVMWFGLNRNDPVDCSASPEPTNPDPRMSCRLTGRVTSMSDCQPPGWRR